MFRKAYGPTGVSFHYTAERMAEDIRNEKIHYVDGNVIKAIGDAEKQAIALRSVSDCAMFHNGKFTLVMNGQ